MEVDDLAQKQVAARLEGDVFQGMFFWYQAAALLRPSSSIAKVVLEHDLASGVDDVAVFYGPRGVNAGGRQCTADFFQVKYHVDQSTAYSCAAVRDRALTGAKHSLLERFATAYRKLVTLGGWFRLHLVSNWHWTPEDPLGPFVRESEGELPQPFFSAGRRSKLGQVRETWRAHLQMTDAEFRDFASRLRFGVDHLGRRGFRDALNDRLINVGLLGIAEDKAQSMYDSLAQQFVMNGNHEFDATAFRQMCAREGLLVGAVKSGPPVVGIRSFMRFAERMEDECDRFVCVAKHFDGRFIRDARRWQIVRAEVERFLADETFRAENHNLLLDCHSSLAFLAGYELDRKSGARVAPVQKGARPGVWRPSGECAAGGWNASRIPLVDTGRDIVVAVSVTRDVMPAVRTFIAGRKDLALLVDARPSSGVGANSVLDADHALALADELVDLFREHRPAPPGKLHLFTAAPNGLLFFVGQHRAALGNVQLYEFDFEGDRGGSYLPSISFPG
jgi:hypothetical protein